jgi:hypothetical protein
MPTRFGERTHGITDLTLLTAVVALALGTWAFLADANGTAAWKPATGVAVTVLLALATLTRQPRWAAVIRMLTGAWIIAAPHVLGFAQVAPAVRLSLTIGTVVATLAMPGFVALTGWRTRAMA